MKTEQEGIYIGIDISKDHLDVGCYPNVGKVQRYSYDEAGLEQLLLFLSSKVVRLVVMEATGGLERSVQVGWLLRSYPCV